MKIKYKVLYENEVTGKRQDIYLLSVVVLAVFSQAVFLLQRKPKLQVANLSNSHNFQV